MPLDPAKVGTELPEVPHTWTARDAILYALAVGAGGAPEDLKYCYENGQKVLPTFAVVPGLNAVLGVANVVESDLSKLLHGEHAIRLHRPIPAEGTVTTRSKVAAIWDKGKGATVVVEAESSDAKGPLFSNTFTAFFRGEGGFGGERGPKTEPPEPPDRAPDAEISWRTLPQQALLYRLLGDRNPLHADPAFARFAGFERPILHGLCTYGFAGRAVLRAVAGDDPARLKALSARFSGVVFPGDTLVTRVWALGAGEARFEVVDADRDEVVLRHGIAEVAPA